MARKAGFHVYTLRVRGRYGRDHEMLDSINGTHDLVDVLHEGLRRQLAANKNDEEAERIACVKRVSRHGRALVGIFTAGHYGEATDIVNSISAEVAYEKQTTDAEMLPCFFRLHLPEDRDEGLLILQRDNRVSSKSTFASLVNLLVMQQIDQDLRVHIEPLVNREEFDHLIRDGAVQTIRFIKMSLTDDLADDYDTGHTEVEGSVEFVIKARKGKSLPFRSLLRRWSRSPQQIREIYSLNSLAFDTVKAEVKIGNKKQTVDFGKRVNTPIIDLSAQVRFGPDGHPTYNSLVATTEELAQGYLDLMYG